MDDWSSVRGHGIRVGAVAPLATDHQGGCQGVSGRVLFFTERVMVMRQFSCAAAAVFCMVCVGLSGWPARTATAAEIDGFRSAKFGSDEKAVRAAILKDFPVREDRIQRIDDKVRKIVGLEVELSVLEPGGPATIYYWMGYSCSCLTRVRVVWRRSPGEDAETASGNMLLVALNLRDHFLARDWSDGGSAISNRLVEQTLILFRGEDSKQRDVLLAAFPVQVTTVENASPDPGDPGGESAGEDAPEDVQGRPTTIRSVDFSEVQVLELVYARNLEQPDVFRIKEGMF